MLDTVFLKVLDMSRAGAVVILIVCGVRLLLRNAPKIFPYLLWAVVLFRLLCPFSIEAPVSAIPQLESTSDSYHLSDIPISVGSATMAAYQAVGDALNGGLGIQYIHTEQPPVEGNVPVVSASWWEVWILFGQYVWVCGLLFLGGHSLLRSLKLRRCLRDAVHLRDNIYLCASIPTPFVWGIFSPKIYLPTGLTEDAQTYVLAHERCHICRGDHIVKLLAYVALCIHWLNPLVWLAFFLAGKDMEMSCDESVIRTFGSHIRADYSQTLLSLTTGRHLVSGTPLAFGDGDAKSRIRNIGKWKSFPRWAWILIAVLCLCIAVLCAVNPTAPTVENVIRQNGFRILSQTPCSLELSIPKDALPDSIFTEKGHHFAENEVIVYQTDSGTSKLYLDYVGYDGPNSEYLLFQFNFSYKLSGAGSIVLPYEVSSNGTCSFEGLAVSKTVRDRASNYPDSAYFRGSGPSEKFCVNIKASVCREAEDVIILSLEGFQILTYASGSKLPAASEPAIAYVSWACHYINPLSSQVSIGGDSGFRYLIGPNSFTVQDRNTGSSLLLQDIRWEWQAFPWSDAQWSAMCLTGSTELIPSRYRYPRYLPLSDQYFLLDLDGALQLVRMHGDTVWSIYELVPEAVMGSALWKYEPYFSSRFPAFPFRFNIPDVKITAFCAETNLTDLAGTTGPLVTVSSGNCLYWLPQSENGANVSGAQIRFSGGDDRSGFYAGTLYLQALEDGVYQATVVGTGLKLQTDPDGYAVISLQTKKSDT